MSIIKQCSIAALARDVGLLDLDNQIDFRVGVVPDFGLDRGGRRRRRRRSADGFERMKKELVEH